MFLVFFIEYMDSRLNRLCLFYYLFYVLFRIGLFAYRVDQVLCRLMFSAHDFSSHFVRVLIIELFKIHTNQANPKYINN